MADERIPDICGLTLEEIKRGWRDEQKMIESRLNSQSDIVGALIAEIERLRASSLAAEVDPRSRNADTQVEPGGEKIE